MQHKCKICDNIVQMNAAKNCIENGFDDVGSRFQASADVWQWEEAKVIDPITVQKICLTCDEEMTDNRFSMCRKCLEHNHSGGGNF